MYYYGEAVEAKAAVLGLAERQVRRLDPPWAGIIEPDKPRAGGDDIRNLVADGLRAAQTYWLADALGQAILDSTATLPDDVVVTTDLLPAPSGFVLWDVPVDEPADLAHLAADVRERYGHRIRAFSWVHSGPCVFVAFWAHGAGGRYTWMHGGWSMLPVNVPDDRRKDMLRTLAETQGTGDEDVEGCIRVGQWVIAFWLWIQQTILVTRAQPLERHVTRRLRDTAMEQGLRVVTLRRAAHATEGEAPHDVEWSCQWIVRGHWRNQFHPKSQAHRPHWILPHVKGPADKPLKVPTDTLFKVTR